MSRAISEIRTALGRSGCRDAKPSSTRGGGGRDRKPTDEAYIKTIESCVATAEVSHAFVLDSGDRVDWIDCRDDLNEAERHYSDGNLDDARELADHWRTPLLATDLGTAFDVFSVNPVDFWNVDDMNRVEEARLRVMRLSAITWAAEDRFTEVIDWANEVRRADGGNEVYDAELAEAAVRANFAIHRTRDHSLRAVNTYFYDADLTFTPTVKQFHAELEAPLEWEATRDRWVARWMLARSDSVAVHVIRHDPSKRRGGRILKPSGHQLSDPLSPGFSLSTLELDLDTKLDPELAERLITTSRRAVASVENGDFALQEQVGTELLEMADHIPLLAPAGHYFIAEGVRLRGDLTDGRDRTELRIKALREYELSRELDPHSVRAVRGLARTYELLGDPDEAANLYQLGYAAALQQLTDVDRGDFDHRWELNHEILRVTRHYVQCLCELRTVDTTSFRARRITDEQLHTMAQESRSLHTERLRLFSGYPRWSQVEWFMGLTILAKSYATIGDHYRAAQELCFAFLERRAMMDPSRPLTSVERSNLRWWLGAARSIATPPVLGWAAALDDLEHALNDASESFVVAALDGLARVFAPMMPPSA